MEQIGVRELRANLAVRVRQAGAGDRVVITVDGHPVAQLAPLEATGAPTLVELAAAGLVEPPRRSEQPAPPDALDTPIDIRLDGVLAEVRGG